MEMWLSAAGEHGVSAVIAFYLLHRVEKKLDILIYTIQAKPGSLTSAIPSIPEEKGEPSHQSFQ
ncbi:YvrJ family protein [Salibacterium salarium]|uniref:YvrJ family protein n=1 Tax=Salibacterium salarium TaxID=284579 RepID=A0A3R9WSM9_9BACI|nr:YvrJ family protein [Salibacterium salarium]RSL32714.1 YvrJ family protein [Salibacterium salarium]